MSADNLRGRILQILLEKHKMDEEFVASQLATVISGETTKRIYKRGKDGKMHLAVKSVTKTPQDVAAGLRVMDFFQSGQLGVGGKVIRIADESRELVRQYAPEYDPRVIAKKNE